ncbi:RND family efflux transporter MFP subunit [Rhodobacter sp. 140A]|nr:RND family efflux transporter MFP subunit [Rhodobacter sp. 140A]
MKTYVLPLALLALAVPQGLRAEQSFNVTPTEVVDWKAVYGQIEAKDSIAARARLGGTLTELSVTEGELVQAGQPIGKVVDEKIAFQLSAIDAQIAALQAQLANAQTELKRGQELSARGITTTQALDALRTQVDVYMSQIEAQQASRKVTEQQATEGEVLAPISGRVLSVPVAMGAVVMAGETVATVGGGGFFLRISVPERFTATLKEGDAIHIDGATGAIEGKLVKVYPLIEGGRVDADVEVPNLDSEFVQARVLVRLPLARREAILVPATAVLTRSGLDFVRVRAGEGTVERAVVPGDHRIENGTDMVEIITGLTGGEEVVTE